MSYITANAARWIKSVKFTLSIAVHRGGLAKNHFWLVATQKERIGEQLNYFWNMWPKPFSWAKNKRELFSDGKSRGPLLARAALKRQLISNSGLQNCKIIETVLTNIKNKHLIYFWVISSSTKYLSQHLACKNFFHDRSF